MSIIRGKCRKVCVCKWEEYKYKLQSLCDEDTDSWEPSQKYIRSSEELSNPMLRFDRLNNSERRSWINCQKWLLIRDVSLHDIPLSRAPSWQKKVIFQPIFAAQTKSKQNVRKSRSEGNQTKPTEHENAVWEIWHTSHKSQIIWISSPSITVPNASNIQRKVPNRFDPWTNELYLPWEVWAKVGPN